MHEVWGTIGRGSTQTLDMHICWLRRKLGEDAAHPRYIHTVRGTGFRFERDCDRPAGPRADQGMDLRGGPDRAY